MKDFCEGIGMLALACFLWATFLAHDMATTTRVVIGSIGGSIALAAWLGWRRAAAAEKRLRAAE